MNLYVMSRRNYFKANRIKWRLRAITKYGGACKFCGFSDIRALQFDHVEANGRFEKSVARDSTYYKAAHDRFGDNYYQLLCANCNRIKAYDDLIKQNEEDLNRFS